MWYGMVCWRVYTSWVLFLIPVLWGITMGFDGLLWIVFEEINKTSRHEAVAGGDTTILLTLMFNSLLYILTSQTSLPWSNSRRSYNSHRGSCHEIPLPRRL